MIIHSIKDVIILHPEYPNELAVKCDIGVATDLVMPLTHAITLIVNERMRKRESDLIEALDAFLEKRLAGTELDVKVQP